jgi:catechol 2,3-dioxygenase-like lactoylglutathione lyase family enzyme
VIAAIDHVVLTTRDEARCLAFYVGVLRMALERYAEGRIALRFGRQKINIHQPGVMATLEACTPTPSSLHLCFVAAVPLDELIERLRLHDVPIVAGPVVRTGAMGAIRTGAMGAIRTGATGAIRTGATGAIRTGATGAIRSLYVRAPDNNPIEIAVPAQ